MKEKKIKVKKQDMVTPESKENKTETFLEKFEPDICPFGWTQLFLGYHIDRNGITTRPCPFCNAPGYTLRFDSVTRKFSCSICGLSGGLVEYLMFYYKFSLKEAIQYITDYVRVDTPIPPHILK